MESIEIAEIWDALSISGREGKSTRSELPGNPDLVKKKKV